MELHRILDAIETIAPPALAESWDNVGLLLGDRAENIAGPALLTIDLTAEVLAEALAMRAGLVIAYHPPIFQPLTRLSADAPQGTLLLRAARAGVSIYSPHTALDAAKDGLADWLADGLGVSGDRRAIVPASAPDPMQTHKIVVHVPASPPDAIEKVRNALASAGAGHIGEYDLCSFAILGRGTFRPSARANPAVGKRGAVEHAEEHRLEMVFPARALPVLIETLRAFHPYEEPAFDIYRLEGKPDRAVGAGRRVTLDQPASPDEIGARMKAHLGAERVRIATPAGSREPVTKVAVCPGSGASLLDAAISQGCNLFVTGEMKHHETLGALSRGCAVLTAGHTATERGYLPILAKRLMALAPGLDARVSERDREPSRLV